MAMIPVEGTDDDNQISPLPQDYNSPFSPPEDVHAVNDDGPGDDVGAISDTHPVTDSNLQKEEAYDEDLSGASEAGEPNAANTVKSYDPSQDQRREV